MFTPKKKRFHVAVGKSKFKVEADCIVTEDGILAAVLGGEKPHIGAVALSVPRASLRDRRKTSATTSILTLVGHKDDEIAKPAAEFIAKEFKVPAIVVAGVHVNKATKQDVNKLLANAMKAVTQIINNIKMQK